MDNWKAVSNTDGLYLISTSGQIKSLFRGEKIIRPQNNGAGYLFVRIPVNGKKQKCYIHRLVAEAFIPNPLGLSFVNHKDYNPANNSVGNLEWVTPYQNYQYSADAGRYERTEQWKAALKKTLNEKMAKPVIGRPVGGGTELRYDALNDCRKDGFQPSCVCNCCKGIRQTHKGYVWSYG